MTWRLHNVIFFQMKILSKHFSCLTLCTTTHETEPIAYHIQQCYLLRQHRMFQDSWPCLCRPHFFFHFLLNTSMISLALSVTEQLSKSHIHSNSAKCHWDVNPRLHSTPVTNILHLAFQGLYQASFPSVISFSRWISLEYYRELGSLVDL